MASSPPFVWTLEDDKALENALAALPPSADGEAWMREVAGRVPGRSLGEVRRYYEFLMEDVRAIEAGRIALPNYTDGNDHKGDQSQCHDQRPQQNSPTGSGDRKGLFESGRGLSKSEQERRKGIPWTEEEHKLFLIGLSKFGKGDWRSISRNFVISRTPTQVASHAQKYFIRLNSMNRDRRRSSIHDITSISGGGELPSPNQGPITGQNGVAPSAMKQPPLQPPSNLAAMSMYGPVGQPVTGHVVPAAVGTPVMLPHGHPPYVVPMAYPVQAPPMMHRQR